MTKNLLRRSRNSSRWTALSLGAAAIVSAAALTVGCLERPVVKQKPNTSNVFVQNIANKAIDKIDLLFVIDNSTSMADKQSILEQAVPNMVKRLVVPDCVTRDADGNITGRSASTEPATPGDDPTCGTGDLEFKPVNDIHIGVISSSLGSHGTPGVCANGADSNGDDKGYLMPRTPTRTGVPDPHGTGFLVWHPNLKEGEPAGTPVESNLAQLTTNFAAHVVAAGEKGCGFEAQLESWYRLLVDPSPPADVVRGANNIAASTGLDQSILDQRKAFLRPDSLVAIVLLTDENDCSAMDGGSYYPFAGYGWLLTRTDQPLRVATTVCETNPNDPCCYSCLNTSVPSACKDESSFSACAQVNGSAPTLSAENDRANARCFQNQRRFGIDLLYPTSRYVSALKSTKITDAQDNTEKDNPLFIGQDASGKRVTRDPSFVFFAGITGVPWADISTEASRNDPNTLQYLTAEQLSNNPDVTLGDGSKVNRWALILGEPGKPAGSIDCRVDNPSADCGKAPVAPLDPFMIESIVPRTGTNPLTGVSTTMSGTWNDVNGHEYNNAFDNGSGPANDDLQYSCIFPLAPYDGVKEGCDPNDFACDCGDEPSKDRPLCKETSTSTAGTSQYWGKAYPATRVLQVLRDFGANSIVASICPKVHENPNSPAYGFNPAVGAIVDRLAEKLGGQCLPRELTVDDQGLVECAVIEAFEGSLNCATPGRRSLTEGNAEEQKRGEQLTLAVRKQLEVNGQCEGAGCDAFNLCEIQQFRAGQGREDCLNKPVGSEGNLEPGYCYVDPAKGLGSKTLVATCDPTEARLLRFVGPDTPVNNSITFVACAGDAAQQGAVTVSPMGGAGN